MEDVLFGEEQQTVRAEAENVRKSSSLLIIKEIIYLTLLKFVKYPYLGSSG